MLRNKVINPNNPKVMYFDTIRIRAAHFAALRKIFLIMKITTFLLLISMLSVSASSLAQKITLNQRNASLEKVLEEIRRQSGYDLFYTYSMMDNSKPVSVDLKDATVDEALKISLDGQSLTYEIEQNTIVLKFKPQLPAAPKKADKTVLSTVSGTVTDTLSRAIPAATVKLTPGKYVTATDVKGAFAFRNVPAGTLEIEVNDETQTSMHVLRLKQASTGLNEIVVNTGYQKIKPEQSTGATARIGTKEYESQVSTNFLEGIVNKLPGVLINNDVKFQGNSLFQIRGLSTMTSTAQQPLIVIDGYPTSLTLDLLDPNEIESVTVLKDAAASTVYGVRASNGVIVVERKKAKEGRPLVNFRTTIGITPKENHSRYKWDPNQTSTQIAINEPLIPTYALFFGNALGITPSALPPDILIAMRNYLGKNTAAQDNQTLASLIAYNNSKDYDRLFLRNAVTQTYNLDLSGGSKSANYYITANYTGNTLTQRNNNNDQFLLSGRTVLQFNPKFSLDLETDLLDQHALASPVPDISSTYSYERFVNSAGNPAPTYVGSGGDPYYNQTLMGRGGLDALYYPLVDMNLIHNKTHITSAHLMANFIYQLGNGFNLNFGGVYETSQGTIKNLYPLGSSFTNRLIDNYAVPNASGGLTYNVPLGDFLQQANSQTSSYTGRLMLTYNKTIGKDHSINGIIGTEISDAISQVNIS
ncbi:MAG: TonB-dependent receptor plug domain-containing protein, partial [Mucilaginibacter sp.]|nr:TonB-dependent receptor plug domain-containing protein [Mucilaginibacter sp.]